MAETTQNSRQTVPVPQAGEVLVVDGVPGQDIVLEQGFEDASVNTADGKVIFDFANGGQVVLNFTDLYDVQMPNVVMADGTILTVAEFLASFGQEVEPAAGGEGAVAGGGVGQYQEDAGDLLPGLDSWGPLGPRAFAAAQFVNLETDGVEPQLTAAAVLPLEPEPTPTPTPPVPDPTPTPTPTPTPPVPGPTPPPAPPVPGPTPPPSTPPTPATLGSADGIVAESSLDGNETQDAGTNAAGTADIISGTIPFTPGSTGNDRLVIEGVDVTNGGTVPGTYGTLVVTKTQDGGYEFVYKLTQDIQHPNAEENGGVDGRYDDDTLPDVFDMEVLNGSTVVTTNQLTITVTDDGPIKASCIPLVALLEEESAPKVGGGVIGNNEDENGWLPGPGLSNTTGNKSMTGQVKWGADGFGGVVQVKIGDNTYEVSGKTTIYFDKDGQPIDSDDETTSRAVELWIDGETGKYSLTVVGALDHGPNPFGLASAVISG